MRVEHELAMLPCRHDKKITMSGARREKSFSLLRSVLKVIRSSRPGKPKSRALLGDVGASQSGQVSKVAELLIFSVAFVKANEEATVAADDDPLGLAKTFGQAHRARLASEQAVSVPTGRQAGPVNRTTVKKGMSVGPRATRVRALPTPSAASPAQISTKKVKTLSPQHRLPKSTSITPAARRPLWLDEDFEKALASGVFNVLGSTGAYRPSSKLGRSFPEPAVIPVQDRNAK